MAKAGVKRLTINQLTPNSSDFLIVVVIISKRGIKKFPDKRDGSLRAVCGLTVRDSPADFINVTVWGSELFVDDLFAKFDIGDVVDIINPKVGVRKQGTSQFEPAVTSFLELIYNEFSSEMIHHDSEDSIDFVQLLRLPTKPPTYFITIADVKAQNKALNGQFVNLLVAVQKINSTRTVSTRRGESLIQDVEVMDQSSLGFVISTWELPIINMIAKWQPRETCLFLSDVKLNWSEFKEQVIGILTSKSIVTENPSTKEASALSNYALTVPTQPAAVVDALAASMENPDLITTIMSCDAVLERAMSGIQVDSFTALVYAVVETYNLDGCVPVIRLKCSICGTLIKNDCTQEECKLHPTYGLVSASYDIRITLIDHTNSLENCRLKGNIASKLLSCAAEEFMQLSNEQKIELKWRFLLKKVAARLVVLPALNNGTPFISIVSLERSTLSDFSLNFPMC